MANEFYHVPGATNDAGYGVSAKVYSVNYIKALYGRIGAWRFMRNHSAEVANFGESVVIPSLPRLTAVDLDPTTGIPASYEDTAIGRIEVLINKYKMVSYKLVGMTVDQSKLNIEQAFAENSAEAVSKAIDKSMFSLISSLSTNSVGSLGSDISEDTALAAMGALVGAGADLAKANEFVWVLPYSQFAAVKKLKGYTDFRIVAPSTNSEGMADVQARMETLFGLPIVFGITTDTELTVSGGRQGGLFHRDSVAVAIQKNPEMLPIARFPGTDTWDLSCKALYGINISKDALACKILCK